ncbi:MAG: V-type ATP synthase subunit I [Eubacteriaceae bacterium]|nr:V-type ATP synthase subunit I [Eubacteriaceae bacterium]
MIVGMKKGSLIIMKADRDAVLKALQQAGEWMTISEEAADAPQGESSAAEKPENALAFLSGFAKKPSLFSSKPEVTSEALLAAGEEEKKTAAETERVMAAISNIDAELSALRNENETLTPWLDMDKPIEDVVDTRHVRVLSGFAPEEALPDIEAALGDTGALSAYGGSKDGVALLLYLYRLPDGEMKAKLSALSEAGFNEGQLPKISGKPKARYDENKAAIDRLLKQKEDLEATAKALSDKAGDVALLSEQVRAETERSRVTGVETAQTLLLKGWVREDRTARIEAAVSGVTEVYDLRFADPAEDEVPPTVTQNPHFLSQFETITDMFSLPKIGTLDPAPVAGIWYWIIFGMMMGDVGYGACMFVIFFLFKKIKKPTGEFGKLINVLFYSSITTIIFGVLFGSYFGETWHPIMFAPLDNPMGFLIFTMVIGVLHIFSGMGIKATELIRDGKILDAIFDVFSWMILITGLPMLLLPELRTAGIIMSVLGAAIILLTAGRDKPTIVGKITGGLLGLYDISSYLSDILSYSRILALSLATGVIGMVMNLLARMVAVGPIGFVFALLIYIVGHVFNLAMSLLSAYVHDSRLQYIEFFGKFYEGGGKPFKPLALRPKHFNVNDQKSSHS